MPRIELTDRETIFDIYFRKAIIEDIDYDNDTADIEILKADDSVSGEKYEDVPLFYHCEPQMNERTNGALEGAAQAFEINDRVYVQFVGEHILIMGRVWMASKAVTRKNVHMSSPLIMIILLAWQVMNLMN